ncbi:uncharacterized protein LOC143028892 [Oratosquilla oratoria]|uniref:uncharacterized protein LOC143028892 n=1 Tax=Oratosquilla oratoria TaxID=337810 RepID=UPI003F757DE5
MNELHEMVWTRESVRSPIQHHFYFGHRQATPQEYRGNKTTKKLNRLYGGPLLLPQRSEAYINLSDHTLTEAQKELLDLGLNCHLQPKFEKVDKAAEMELLLQSLFQLQKDGKVTVSSDLQPQLLAETTKRRSHKISSLLSPQLKQAASELYNNPNLVIRQADKSSIYVLLNKEDYVSKINHILSDTSTFNIIDPTSKLKVQANKLTAANNAVVDHLHIPPITVNCLLVIFTVTSKHTSRTPPSARSSYRSLPLNNIITPFIPKKYSLKSSDDFIDTLHSKQPQGIMASLAVESLFSHVLILPKIDIIPNNVYHHPELHPPRIPEEIMKHLLLACTTESPFRSPSGQLYLQVEGVAMGSPLGCTFAEFYMCNLENKVLQDSVLRPFSYYNNYTTTVYRKKTDTGICLNAAS